MNILRNLFGNSANNASGNDLTVYVRPKMCQEILPIRVRLNQELSLNQNEDGYVVRKVTKAPRCPFEVEVFLEFDKRKRLASQRIENGEFVTEEDYIAQQAI